MKTWLFSITAMVISCAFMAPEPAFSAPPRAPKAEVQVDDAFCKSIEQEALEVNTRRYYRTHCGDAVECRKRHNAFIRFRTENYGRFPGFGKASWNSRAPGYYARTTDFMGLKVSLNQWVIPALECAEREVQKACKSCVEDPEYPNECKKRYPYKPRKTSGIRYRNTFRGGEVSNHVYGIAVDFDPTKNTCCGCVAKWRNHPLCRKDLKPHERMIMPVCWVHVFEKYGFYWLGRDRLQDTMHFEFLGKPEIIEEAMKKKGAPVP